MAATPQRAGSRQADPLPAGPKSTRVVSTGNHLPYRKAHRGISLFTRLSRNNACVRTISPRVRCHLFKIISTKE